MGELSAPVVVLRVTVRAPDLDAFITRYSRHIAGDRIFIFSKAPQPVGTQVRFNLQLANGEVLIQGRGTVKRVQKDEGDARHPPGMEVQFKPLDERSSTLVDFMMATRAGLTEPVVAAKAPPLVRAVIPPKPKPLSTSSSPLFPRPAPKSETPPPLPPLPTPKSKPIPVARPPSMSLESVWKNEASEEKTFAEAPTNAAPPADAGSPPIVLPDSAPLALVAASHIAAAAATPDDSVPTALSAGLSSLSGEVTAPVDPQPETRSEPLGTIVPPTADPSVNAPMVFAESWGGDAPANPFSDVSDGAIEYFVEWSLEQSIGPRALPQAQFSDVPMALPGQSGRFAAFDRPTRRRLTMMFGAVFAAGLLVGGVVVALVKRAPPHAPAPVVAAVEPAAVAAPPPAKTEAADAEVAISTRPDGASVSIDGNAAGTTPLTTRLSAGKHEVVVTKERYTAITTTTEAPGTLSLDLRRPTATLHVTSTPPAADVVVAGEHRGKTPVDVKLPGFESYDVRVGKGWHKKIYLSHAQNRVDAALASPPSRAGRR